MKRFALATCLLAVSGLAAAQSGADLTLIGGAGGNLTVINPPVGDTINIGDFQPIFGGTFQAYIIPNAFTDFGAAMRPELGTPAFPVALDPGGLLSGEVPIVTVEEEGVRMPDEQFSLPETP